MVEEEGTLIRSLGETLYRAGVYVAYADTSGEFKGDFEEAQSDSAQTKELNTILFVLEQFISQASEKSFLASISHIAKEKLLNSKFISVKDASWLKFAQEDLRLFDVEIEQVVVSALEHFSEDDVRLYCDSLISLCASVAQKNDESLATLGGAGFFDTLLMMIGSFQKGHKEDNFYEENDIFDHMKFSYKEDIAMSKIVVAMQKAWSSRLKS